MGIRRDRLSAGLKTLLVSAFGRRRPRNASNILIAGLAKTGTTILFARVLASLPEKPRTYFEPRKAADLDKILTLGRRAPTLTKALVGDITAEHTQVSSFSHVVLIVRDPRDQFVSELLYEFYKFQQSGNLSGFEEARKLLVRKVEDPGALSAGELFKAVRASVTGQEVKDSLIRILRLKYEGLARFLDAFDPFLVRYEDVIDDRLSDLAGYLGVPEIRNAEVDESLRRVARSKRYGDWKNWLTPADLEDFQAELGVLMLEFGYAAEPAAAKKVIPSETSLGYVDQFRPPSAS